MEWQLAGAMAHETVVMMAHTKALVTVDWMALK